MHHQPQRSRWRSRSGRCTVHRCAQRRRGRSARDPLAGWHAAPRDKPQVPCSPRSYIVDTQRANPSPVGTLASRLTPLGPSWEPARELQVLPRPYQAAWGNPGRPLSRPGPERPFGRFTPSRGPAGGTRSALHPLGQTGARVGGQASPPPRPACDHPALDGTGSQEADVLLRRARPQADRRAGGARPPRHPRLSGPRKTSARKDRSARDHPQGRRHQHRRTVRTTTSVAVGRVTPHRSGGSPWIRTKDLGDVQLKSYAP